MTYFGYTNFSHINKAVNSHNKIGHINMTIFGHTKNVHFSRIRVKSIFRRLIKLFNYLNYFEFYSINNFIRLFK